MDKKPLPPLKAGIEAFEIMHEGQPMVVLRDQEGLTDRSIAISMGGFLVATLLNGKNSAADIQSAFAQNGGSLLSETEIGKLVGELEKADLLETESLREKRRKVLADFTSSPVRPAVFANAGYPGEPMELASFMGKFFQDPKGPGKQFASAPSIARPPLALVSPHIDLPRGGPAYAWAYQALSESPPPDVVLALGVAHLSPNSPWVLTKKSYETPYGPVLTDEALYNAVQKTLWYEGRADEWVHRREHSLEFQALWLKYLWREKTPAWLPVLCSSFESYCSDRAPSSISTIETAIQQMGAALKSLTASGKRVMILAGVDLGHVGPRFGDEEKVGPELEQRLEKEDRASLELALKLDADPFYMSVVKNGHWRKWCGLSALYTTLRLVKIMGGEKTPDGKLLTYGQAPDPMGGIVSFTGMIFP